MQVVEQLLVNATTAAKMLGVGRSLFYQMSEDGRLGPKYIQFGSKRLWSTDELRSWIAAGCPARENWQKVKDAENG